MMRCILTVSIILVLAACGKESSTGPTLQGNYYGNESGTKAGQQISSTVSLSLTEANPQITGSLNVTGTTQQTYPTGGSTYPNQGASGSISGVLVGSEIRNFILTLSDPSCRGNLVGKGTISGVDITASVSGTTSCGEVTINISVRRQ